MVYRRLGRPPNPSFSIYIVKRLSVMKNTETVKSEASELVVS